MVLATQLYFIIINDHLDIIFFEYSSNIRMKTCYMHLGHAQVIWEKLRQPHDPGHNSVLSALNILWYPRRIINFKSFWSVWWLDMQSTVVVSLSSHDHITVDCHQQGKQRIAALPWHTCRQQFACLIWLAVDITALTHTLKPRHRCWAGAAARGVVSSGTLASRDSAAGSVRTLMDVKDIPS